MPSNVVAAMVRQRLEGDPQAYKIPTDMAEIYAIGDFLSAEECTRLMRMIDGVARPSELHETAYVAKFRTSYSGNFDPHDPFVKALAPDRRCARSSRQGARISRASVICPGRNSSRITTGSTPIRIIGSWSASGAASAAGPRWRFSTRSKKAGTRISSRSAPRSNPNPGCCWCGTTPPATGYRTNTRCMRERPSSRARNTCSPSGIARAAQLAEPRQLALLPG